MGCVREAVPGAAFDVLDEDVLAACANGDAVVPGGDDGVGDLDVGGVAEMDAVGVGAVLRGGDGHVCDLYVSAVDHLAVEPHRVQERQAAYVTV